jgi:6-phosphofructokinase 1
LLNPDHYSDGGLLPLDARAVEDLDPNAASLLGQSARIDPFHVRRVNEDDLVEEIDQSDDLLGRLKQEKIDALVSVVGGRGLSILYKLHRKGLNTVCIPRSVENDVAATAVSFGYNTALSFTIEMLDRARQAARSARQIGVVEVLGQQAGWLALQSGIAVGADAVLIPEMPYDLSAVAACLKEKMTPSRPYGLVVVAEGAKPANSLHSEGSKPTTNSLRASLSPLATGDSGEHVIQLSGKAAQTVASQLQLLIAEETYPLVLGPWSRGGTPTAVDRQLGLAYGAAAVEALKSDQQGVMAAFCPPHIEFIPLSEAINKVRNVRQDSEFVLVARSLGICLGSER